MAHSSKIVTPHAGVIIWNYADRINASGGEDVHDINEIIISSSSLISISTSKRKSTPAGSFEFQLAPTHNWVARITPGSWCVLLMSQTKPIPQITNTQPGSADPKLLKMLGRISEVRVAVEVDQETGARKTAYVVTGQDWCSVFDTKLYIDPVARNNALDDQSPIGHSYRIGFDSFFTEWTDDKHIGLPSSTQVVDAIIKIWGSPVSDISSEIGSTLGSSANPIQDSPNLLISTEAQFKLPVPVAQYMGLGGLLSDVTGPSVNFAKVIERFDGVLDDYDSYSGDNNEAQGIPNPDSFYKVNSFWQMLIDNSNPAINELVTDLRWDDDQASLALYKRVKPFINRSSFDGNDGGSNDGPEIKKNISMFANVRRVEIPLEDVVKINGGTNWRDKVNFIEIRPSQQLIQNNFDTLTKVGAQAIDRPAYEREGFKPLIQNVYYMPYNGNDPAPVAALQWKFLLREWYFNTHLMLNGSVTIIGQDQYIQVGDNIQIPAEVFGPASFNSLQPQQKAYFTAHVEAVAHTFNVEPNGGARSFATTIQFVRGVFTHKNGQIFGGTLFSVSDDDSPLDGAIDRDATDLTSSEEKNIRVITTSTSGDFDKNKKRGT